MASDQHSAGGQEQPVPLSGPQSFTLTGEFQDSPLRLLGSGKVGMKPVPAYVGYLIFLIVCVCAPGS